MRPNREPRVSVQQLGVFEAIAQQEDQSIQLFLTDPPYYKIAKSKWDHQWATMEEYLAWWMRVLHAVRPKLAPTATVIFFGAIGRHGHRPFQRAQLAIEEDAALKLFARDTITWRKRRAYGCPDRYLFTREEIAYYSCDPKTWTFHVPLLEEKRGYAGFNKKHPAKSEFKRVSNVWYDIPELFAPRRECENPEPLMQRLIETHSNPGDLIFDPFAGLGVVEVVASRLGRRSFVSDNDPTLFVPTP